jgi:chromosome segregation protein
LSLHLKSITLKGFKSFAQATTIELEPGITCVVGPNGSGKSNIVDALAWVMGEQGAKTLRGGKMEDVIFAGTSTKAPLGRAEVSLTIDNSDGALPIEYAEVTISRVLFRNGASEYSINQQPCRLLDVQELLSDTGLGREMHVIVGQGQLDTVLRATPLERRAFIEEAAGILKFRRRKEKTERKLEAMQSNLTRLHDLIAEIRRNLKPLGRQAEVARSAQEIGAVARHAKSQLLSVQVRNSKEQLEVASKSENERKAESSFAQQQLASARTAIAQIESELSSDELDQARSKLFRFEAIEQKLRNLKNLADQRVSLLAGNQPESAGLEIESLETELSTATDSLREIELEIQASASKLAGFEQARQLAAEAMNLFDADAIRQRSQQESQVRERNQATGDVSVQEARIESIAQARLKLQDSISQAESRVTELTRQQSAMTTEGLSTSDDELRKGYELAQLAESKARKLVDESRQQLHFAERERDALAARHAALGLTLDQSDGGGEAIRAKLQGIKGLLAKSVSIEKGFEKAIAVALGALSDAIVVDTKAQAIEAIRFLKAQDLGRAEFLITSSEVETGKLAQRAGLVNASTLVSAPKSVLALLEHFYVAASLDDAERALEIDPEITVITKDGDLVSEYSVRGGGTKLASKLELSAERDFAAKGLTKFESEIQDLANKLSDAEAGSVAATAAVKTSLSELQEHDARLAASAERAGRLIAQLDSGRAEIARFEAEIELQDKLAVTASQELEALAKKVADFPEQSSVEVSIEARLELSKNLDSSRQQELEARIEAGTLAERSSASSKQLAVLTGRLAEAVSAKLAANDASLARESQLASAREVLSKLPQVMTLTQALSSKLRVELLDLEAKRSQRSERLAQLRSQAIELEARFTSLNSSVHEVEMQNYELRLTLQNLKERVESELSMSIEELLEENAEVDQPVEELQKLLRQAEAKLAQLGAFNPLALEEFSALEERHKYLSDQLADLTAARADLTGIIGDLDGKMQHIFASAFEDTKKEFEKVFPLLFPGGTGSLSLTDPDNLLATGLEVSVKPAGKRIERMSLLSGGERSLAAVALLISIFKARPSPFYVLDEVEAALDDSNLGRLLNVIKSLRDSSQLIVVTHQKRTMEIADALYGVSMRQDGITQVVGQRVELAN